MQLRFGCTMADERLCGVTVLLSTSGSQIIDCKPDITTRRSWCQRYFLVQPPEAPDSSFYLGGDKWSDFLPLQPRVTVSFFLRRQEHSVQSFDAVVDYQSN